MNGQNLSPLMMTLLTGLALYFPLSNARPASTEQNATVPKNFAMAQGAAPSSTDGTSSQGGNKSEQGAAVKLLCDFFGLKNQTSDKDRFEDDYCSLERIQNRMTRKGKEFRVVHIIATIPDPQESRLDYLSDYYLDAMQRALENMGYVLDRYWLPWKKPHNPQSEPTQVIIVPTQPAVPQTHTRRDYTRKPGVMLFRHINDVDKLLVLFLIGETPTSGIHKAAFLNALAQTQQLPQGLTSLDMPIRVLGPTFSGSTVSLAMSLRNWLDGLGNSDREYRQVRIISGSATAVDTNVLRSLIGHDGRVTFHATVRREHEAWNDFMRYLKIGAGVAACGEASNQSPQIAILSEANTSFGQEVRTRAKCQDKSTSKKESTLDSPPVHLPVLSLTFPLHISRLRAEVAKTKPAHSEIANGMLTPLQNIPLPMDESDEEKRGDVVPLFSSLEAASIELVLDKILSAIRREPIRYIGLFATDVQDRIFLTRALRRHAPNTALFIFGADLLYLHSEANLDFRGTLVITSYPLFSLNQLWSFPFNGMSKRLQFPTTGTQGVYNAMWALLGMPKDMIEYGRPFDQGKPGSPHQPVNWLSIVGHSDIWPVSILSTAEPEKKAPIQAAHDSYTYLAIQQEEPSADGPTNYRYYSSLSIGLLLFVGLLCLVPSVVLLLQWRHANRWINKNWIGKIFRFETHYRYNRLIYLFYCCVSLLMMALIISVVSLLPSWIEPRNWTVEWEWNLVLQMLACAMLVLTLLLLFITIAVWLVSMRIQQMSLRQWAFALVVATFVVGVVIAINREMLVSTPLLLALLTIAVWLVSMRIQRPGLSPWSCPPVLISFAISPVIFALVCRTLYELVRKGGVSSTAPEAFFFFLRATEFRSGVSPLLPWLFIVLAAFLSCLSIVRRLDLADRTFGLYLNFATPSFTSLGKLEYKIKALLICPIFIVPGARWLSALIVIPYICRFVLHYIPSIEGPWFDSCFIMAFYLVPLLLSWMFLRLFWFALALRKLLKRLGSHPLFHEPIDDKAPAFQTLPKISLMSLTPTYTALSSSVTLAQGFFRLLNPRAENTEIAFRSQHNMRTIGSAVTGAEQKLHRALEDEAHGRWREALEKRRAAQKAISEASSAIAAWMEPHWNELHNPSSRNRTLITQGRLFLMSHTAAFLQYSLVQLQHLAGLVTAGLLLILLAETSYPFQPRDTLLLFGWVSILVAVIVMIFIFVHLSRDRVISLLAGTTPNQLNWTSDLVFRILIHGVLPILVLLSAQFPAALQNLLSWFSFLQGKGQ